MLSRSNGLAWMEAEEEADDAVSWARPTNNQPSPPPDLSSFKSMLDGDWYVTGDNLINPPPHPDNLQLNPDIADDSLILNPTIQTASFCSPLDPTSQPKSSLPSFLNVFCTNTSLEPAFNFPTDPGFLRTEPGSNFELSGLGLTGLEGFEGPPLNPNPSTNANPMLFNNRPKTLRALEVLPPIGSTQPTLFQKRAMLRQASIGSDKLESSGFSGMGDGVWGDRENRRRTDDDCEELVCSEGGCFDVSMVNCDSDEAVEEGNDKNIDGNITISERNFSNSNANSIVTGGGGDGDKKGKRKGLPAKNLMAERRRRKKLNDRLYMLRSVVPKISKMDRASILGDAIDYLKELLQKINDLHNELESSNPGSLMPTNPHPSTPVPHTLPCRVKDELCPNSLSIPKNQPARIEVRARGGRAVNIRMFCSRRPGLLLSTVRALDNLGLDIQQAVISCFNGFALDIFRAEQCREGHEILPEEIKAVLLDSAGFHGVP